MHNSREDNAAIAAIIPQTQTNADTAIVGPIMDCGQADELQIVFVTGAVTDADATFTVSFAHGDDSGLSDTADAAAYIKGTLTFTFAFDSLARALAYVGPKRYVRMTVTPSGNNSGAFPIAAVGNRRHNRKQPVTSS